ncbi:MAG: sigma 54-interacting transcriptional regulator [Syntrophaceae bacterium]|nr:sigma 54-interacting transcriptional regulator [Syntrophaceae bacterium]
MIIVTGFGSIDCVVRTIKMGARNYVRRSSEQREIFEIVRDALHRREHEIKSLRRVNEPYCCLVDEVIGVLAPVEQASQTASAWPMSTAAFSSTARAARARNSSPASPQPAAHRREREFVAINCTAILDEIPRERVVVGPSGGLQGPSRPRGLVEAADGDAFVDEIGDTSRSSSRSWLLPVIQEKEIRRVGETASRPSMCIVAATNRDLKKMIGEGASEDPATGSASTSSSRRCGSAAGKDIPAPRGRHFSRISTEDSGPKSRDLRADHGCPHGLPLAWNVGAAEQPGAGRAAVGT